MAFATGDDGEEVAVAHDLLDTGHGRNAVRGSVLEVCSRAGRPHDPGVQHAVELQVMDEAWAAKHLVGQVDSSQVLRCGRCQLDVERGLADPDVQVDDAGKVGVRTDPGAVAAREHTGHQPDVCDFQPGLARGRATEQLTRFSADAADRRPGDGDRQTARGQSLVG